jgi:hypothetical protein
MTSFYTIGTLCLVIGERVLCMKNSMMVIMKELDLKLNGPSYRNYSCKCPSKLHPEET